MAALCFSAEDALTRTQRALLALALVAAGLAVSALAPTFFEPQPFVLFLLIALIAAWLAGWEGGFAAAISGAVAGVVVLRVARGGWTVPPAAGLWLAITLLAASLVASLRSALLRMRQALAEQTIPPNRPVRTQWFEVTLSSIGDAVIATDEAGAVVFVNDQAAQLTGWPSAEAQGRPLHEIFQIRNEDTGAEVENPVARVLRENRIVGLANHTLLIRRDGTRFPIADSGAPIHAANGDLLGVVLVFRDVTQQREAERLLRLSEERLRTAIKNARMIVFSQDRDLRYTWIDNSIQGRTTADVLGKRDEDLIPDPDDAARIKAFKREVLESGTGAQREMIAHQNGRAIHLAMTVEPLRDADGTVYGIIGAALDITAQKQQEQRLAQALADADYERRRLRAVLTHLPVLILIADADGQLVDINDTAQRVFQEYFPNATSIAEFQRFQGYWTESGEPVATDDWPLAQAVFNGKITTDVLIDVVIGDGTRRSFMLSAAPIRGDDEAIIGGIAVIIDVTDRYQEGLERERLLDQIGQERDRLRTLIDSATDEIWFCDAEGNIELANAAVRDTFSLEDVPPGALGPVTTFVTPLEIRTAEGLPRRPEDAPLLRALRGETIRNEIESVRRTTQDAPAFRRVSAAPLTNSSGDIVGAVAVVHDITEQIKAEEAIHSLNAELEQRVRERTAQLSAVNRELEAFSYSVSHDLRTPLRAIDGFSLALLEDYSGTLDQEAQYYLERIRSATQRMGQLIDDLLKLSRLTRSDIQRTPTDLSQIAQSILDELHDSQPERRVQAAIQPSLVVEGDAQLLRVALENLLHNAWKFTSKTENAQIEFGTLDYEDERVYYVRDNGAGFDMSYADKLFRAFQRLHSPAEFEGTGIGLATVQRIIHRHRGRIWAQGAVNEGATFFFTLPNHRGNGHDRGTSENHPAG